jgi:hypothetical protein
MSNPFPLSKQDYADFVNDVGFYRLSTMPDWGTIFFWRNRYVLAFQKVDDTFALTDISGGIPTTRVASGVIPAEILVHNTPTTQTSTFGVFMFSLPSNFMDIAIEKAKAAAATGAEIIAPLVPALGITSLIIIGVLVFMYAPRPRS